MPQANVCCRWSETGGAKHKCWQTPRCVILQASLPKGRPMLVYFYVYRFAWQPKYQEVLKLYLLIKGSNYQGKLSLSACPSRQLLKFIHPMTVLPSNCPVTTHSRCLSKTRSLSEAAWITMWRLFHKNQFSVLLLSLILRVLHAPFVLPSMEITYAMY